MCGRCRVTLRADDVPRACYQRSSSTTVRHVDTDRYRPRHNVSPGSYLPVLRRDSAGNDQSGCNTVAVQCMKWGLIPSFTKKDEKPDHFKMFNARSESMFEKASFRRLIPNNRCLVAVEGFYEWKKGPKGKQPYYIHFKDDRPLVFAALYDSWKNAEGETLYTFTILTTASSSALQWLHDRMPVILGDEVSADKWLSGSSDTKFSELLNPYEKTDLAWYPVTPAMNKASFDDPECIKEITLKSEEQSNTITNFFSKKGTSENKQLSAANKSSLKKSTDTDLHGNVEDGSAAQPSQDSSLSKDSAEVDVSGVADGSDPKVDVKRTYEQFMSDSKPSMNEPSDLLSTLADSKPNMKELSDLPSTPVKKSKLPSTPVKKSKVKSGSGKQTTLGSYFAKG